MKFLKAILVVVFCLVSAGAWALTADDVVYMTEETVPPPSTWRGPTEWRLSLR